MLRHRRPPLPRFPIMLLAVMLLTACQPLPHPFAESHIKADAPILAVSDAVGIDVRPVKGAPQATAEALAKGMTAGLQAADIPASANWVNDRSYRLAGDASGVKPDAGGGTIVWTLTTAQGKPVGQKQQAVSLDGTTWRAGGQPVHDLGQAESAAIAALIQPPAVVSRNDKPAVYIRPITGAPGDGDESLARSMTYLLRRQGLQIADHPAENTIAIACTVQVTAAPNKSQKVDITWHVIDVDGKEIGQIAQSNVVPAGTLDGRWQDIAIAVANAAADSVISLVKRGGHAAS
ncbi:MAG TPA: hypothetical protein VL574_06170 [Stellaceae bacterium]|nr:hypothetical protein [Stellaceae bacterium]